MALSNASRTLKGTEHQSPLQEACSIVWPTFMAKTFFLCPVWPSTSAALSHSHLSLVTRSRDWWLPLCFPSSGICREPWGFLSDSSKQGNPSVLSFSQDVASSPFARFVVRLWMLTRTLSSFLYCGDRNCTQYSRWHTTNTKYSRRINSFDGLAWTMLDGATSFKFCHKSVVFGWNNMAIAVIHSWFEGENEVCTDIVTHT